MNGVIVVNKHKGCTSRDIVNDLIHIFHTKKIGHTGTLDPIATGVLVITIGTYTKLGNDLTSLYKEYIAEAELGYETDTLDNTGNITNRSNIKVSEEEIKNVILSYQKKYDQEVPLYSSIKINGKKLYEYARCNEEVKLPKREVDIKEIEVLSINNNKIKFRCLVSKGTYIRSLIRDIGSSLNTYATMTSLIRTKQGKFSLEEASTINDIRSNNYHLLKIEDLLDVEIINCDYDLYHKVNNGVKLSKEYDKEYVLFKYNNEDICLYKKDEEYFRMYLKF